MRINITRELDHDNIELARKWLKKSPEDLEIYVLEKIRADQQNQLIIEMATIIAALTKYVKFQ